MIVIDDRSLAFAFQRRRIIIINKMTSHQLVKRVREENDRNRFRISTGGTGIVSFPVTISLTNSWEFFKRLSRNDNYTYVEAFLI